MKISKTFAGYGKSARGSMMRDIRNNVVGLVAILQGSGLMPTRKKRWKIIPNDSSFELEIGAIGWLSSAVSADCLMKIAFDVSTLPR